MFPHNNEGRDELLSIYDHESLQEIASHGCESGVCSQHIYYGDTLAFFDKYEGEILDLIHIRYGVDTLVDIFKQHDACYDAYRNDCCWLFIENVATDYVIEMENMEEKENMLIEEYMKPDDDYEDDDEPIKLYAHYSDEEIKVLQANGFNPQRSMTLNRYSNV